jgi:hypothetical protein
MKPFLQLNLVTEKEKAEAAKNPPEQEKEPAEPVVTDHDLNRMVNRFTHRAATRGGGQGIFSK